MGNGERRADTRHATFTFERLDQRRLFTANVGACAKVNTDIEVEPLLPENRLAEKVCVTALLQLLLQRVDEVAVFTPEIEKPLLCTGHSCTERHPLEKTVGVSLQQQPVLEGPGLPLVCVTDHDFPGAFRIGTETPFHAGTEAGAPATAQAG